LYVIIYCLATEHEWENAASTHCRPPKYWTFLQNGSNVCRAYKHTYLLILRSHTRSRPHTHTLTYTVHIHTFVQYIIYIYTRALCTYESWVRELLLLIIFRPYRHDCPKWLIQHRRRIRRVITHVTYYIHRYIIVWVRMD
jgi:hypothetical protein